MSASYAVKGPVTNAELNALFSVGWPSWQTAPDTSDWSSVLAHCLAYITARDGDTFVGFVHVAWDGRDHAFLLDPRVHPDVRGTGVGKELVQRAADAAKQAGCEWLHVDCSAELTAFYAACGFATTPAGLLRLVPVL